MNNNSEHLRSIVAHGWISMMLIAVMIAVTDYYLVGMSGDFSTLRYHPGMEGLWQFAILTAIATLTQMAVRSWSGKAFRWCVFALSLIWMLFFMFHQYIHLATGGTFGLWSIYDFTHHIIGIWTSIAAYKWATVDASLLTENDSRSAVSPELRGSNAAYSDR